MYAPGSSSALSDNTRARKHEPCRRRHRKNSNCPRTLWSRAQELVLVETLFNKGHLRNGNGGFPASVWEQVVRRVNDLTPKDQISKSIQSSKSKWTSLIFDCKVICEIKRKFMWDDEKGAGLVPDDEWFKWSSGRRSRLQKFRTRGMPRKMFRMIEMLLGYNRTSAAQGEPALVDPLRLEMDAPFPDPVMVPYLSPEPYTHPHSGYFSDELSGHMISNHALRPRAQTPPELRTSFAFFEPHDVIDTSFLTAAGTTFIGSSNMPSSITPRAMTLPDDLVLPDGQHRVLRRSMSLTVNPMSLTPLLSSPEGEQQQQEEVPATPRHESPLHSGDLPGTLPQSESPSDTNSVVTASVKLFQRDLSAIDLAASAQLAIIEFMTVSPKHANVYLQLESLALREQWVQFQLRNPAGAKPYVY